MKVRSNKPIISEYVSPTTIASVERIHPDPKIVNAIISSQNTFCKLVNKSEEPIALSQITAVALACTIPSSYAAELIDFYENEPQQGCHDDHGMCTYCSDGQAIKQPGS